jgi:hypothetical protein
MMCHKCQNTGIVISQVFQGATLFTQCTCEVAREKERKVRAELAQMIREQDERKTA